MTQVEDLPDAYPLKWPDGVPRTSGLNRERASFGTVRYQVHQRADGTTYKSSQKGTLTIGGATERVLGELDRLGAIYPVLSTNLRLRLDGLPLVKQRNPDDPGVAVYFVLDGDTICFPCDRWDRIADNIAAVAKHIEALRGISRWGVGTAKQAFAGYKALLPGPVSDWRAVLGFSSNGGAPTLETVKRRLRKLMKDAHPDKGGDPEQARKFNSAMQAAEEELTT